MRYALQTTDGKFIRHQDFNQEIPPVLAPEKGLVWVVDEPVWPSTVPAISVDEQASNHRKNRNGMLRESDWSMLPDAPLTVSQKSAWEKYRQELRDVTDQPGFPIEFTWPVAP